MKRTFISDFDNTITRKDFYWIVIDKYLGEQGCELHEKWQKKEMKDIDFLNCAFNSINQPKKVILNDIDSIPIDETAVDFIRWYTEHIGDFVIVSAGCQYYIDIILEKYGVKDLVRVYANPGYYHDNNIYMVPDPQAEYYHDTYGINKAKVVEIERRNADFIYFAGDSRPDFPAAESADIVFARKYSQLSKMLDERGMEYTPFEAFTTVSEYVQSHSSGISAG